MVNAAYVGSIGNGLQISRAQSVTLQLRRLNTALSVSTCNRSATSQEVLLALSFPQRGEP